MYKSASQRFGLVTARTGPGEPSTWSSTGLGVFGEFPEILLLIFAHKILPLESLRQSAGYPVMEVYIGGFGCSTIYKRHDKCGIQLLTLVDRPSSTIINNMNNALFVVRQTVSTAQAISTHLMHRPRRWRRTQRRGFPNVARCLPQFTLPYLAQPYLTVDIEPVASISGITITLWYFMPC